jgi:Lipocalin-like domain
MKTLRLVCILSVSVIPASSLAASDAAREFERVTLERERALAAAAEPINRRYQASLEALLKRATATNDLETAVRIKQVLEKLSSKTPATLSPASVSVVGSWKFKNNADGHTGSVEVNADGSYSVDGKPIGSWEIRNDKLIITLNEGGHQDSYDLPVRGDKLEGRNRLGHPLILRRGTN